MNHKEIALNKIVDIVVSCCATEVDGKPAFTREDVLGKSRAENLVMTRAILAMMILGAGYSITTTAQLLHRSQQAIRHLLEQGHNYMLTSKAFRLANAEATILCKDLDAEVF